MHLRRYGAGFLGIRIHELGWKRAVVTGRDYRLGPLRLPRLTDGDLPGTSELRGRGVA